LDYDSQLQIFSLDFLFHLVVIAFWKREIYETCSITNCNSSLSGFKFRRFDLLLKLLPARPEDLTLMTREQIRIEKAAMQRELLKHESRHGRPSTKEEKEIMRSVYERYR